MKLLENLNPQQREAVLHTEGPLLVLAGAGSGKTGVLTHRVAYLIQEKYVEPYNILAVTFTNKAACEMRERIAKLLGFDSPALWISTFHSASVRILRRHIDLFNFSQNFVIFDTSEQKTLIRECMKELNINEKQFPYQVFMRKISKGKNDLITAEEYGERYKSYSLDPSADVYYLYQKKLKQNNALDFDDLIFYVVRLFRKYPEVLHKYEGLFHYILIDEYQDINKAQYALVKSLADKRRNLFVVGDEDQSIYAFRGADMNIILNFERDFPEARIIKLQQNYRSTGNILDVANELVRNNRNRRDKDLWTHKSEGDRPICHEALDERDEAVFIIDKIKESVKKEKRKLSDFVILYRTNAQSRVFEEVLMSEGLPYQVVGGLKFYDRKEIKDILAYVRILWNPTDTMSFKRIINVPPRGIGDKTVEKLLEFSEETERNLYDILIDVNFLRNKKLPAKSVNALQVFKKLMEDLQKNIDEKSISELLEEVMDKSGYLQSLKDQNSVEAVSRIENLEELLKVAQEFIYNHPAADIDEFLALTSLSSDIDMMEESKESITLMTVHSAKGLEFPVVFITGMEEGLFPHQRSIDTKKDFDIEEERRLAYVALTRAMEKLYLSYAWRRSVYGFGSDYNRPSRFLDEVKDYISRTGEEKDMFASEVARPEIVTMEKKKTTFKSNFYRRGDFIKHKEFGKGVVMEVIGDMMKPQFLKVSFQSAGMKKIDISSIC
ncbi:MAG TPA: 3'-5' exonuclease [Candidatus Eremiobacteraeota bacterium]|nr:3'-5' exonuclease [Candidatus Eremiobacteraeota bacterium]